MPILDFKEIPEAHGATCRQDNFELFARDFFGFIGYAIVQEPDRGPDGGRDLIIEEERIGLGGSSHVKWLVSCKHYAHSGRSVGVGDEQNILDRVGSNSCSGFIGFYSTLASAGLANQLEGLKGRIEIQRFDYEKIETLLLESIEGFRLVERYFPQSALQWRSENPKPERYFWQYPDLICENCGKNLLEPNPYGNVSIWKTIRQHRKDPEIDEIVDVYFTCRGNCDRILKGQFRRKYENAIDGWESIEDICIPTIYVRWLNTILTRLFTNTNYSDDAFKKTKTLLLAIFPHISRSLTLVEKEKIQELGTIPSVFGGLGP